MKIADGIHKDDSCPDIYERIVFTLSQTQDRDAVWKFAEWTLQRNQEVFVFSMRWPLGVKELLNVAVYVNKTLYYYSISTILDGYMSRFKR